MAAGGAGGRAEALELQPVEDILVAAGTVFAELLLGVKIEAGSHDNGADVDFLDCRPLVVVDGAGFAGVGTLAADDWIEAKAGVLVERIRRRNRLRERDVDGTAVGQSNIVLVGYRHRANVGAVVADLAHFGIDIDGLGLDPGLEVADEAGDTLDLALHHQRDLRML